MEWTGVKWECWSGQVRVVNGVSRGLVRGCGGWVVGGGRESVGGHSRVCILGSTDVEGEGKRVEAELVVELVVMSCGRCILCRVCKSDGLGG